MTVHRIFWPHSLTCPVCGTGSSAFYDAAAGADEWHTLRCPSCAAEFLKGTAIDNMFAQGEIAGCAEWTGGVVVAGTGSCLPGQCVLLDVRGKVERPYQIQVGRAGVYLSGGLSAQFVPQGYVMVAVAPDPTGLESSAVDIVVKVVGRAPGAEALTPYKELLLEARRVALEAPKLTAVLAVAAFDLFIEQATGGEIAKHRPGVWEKLFLKTKGHSLKAAMGAEFRNLKCLLAVRDSFAHGRDHLEGLPKDIAEKEARWIAVSHLYEPAIAPSALFALRTTLQAIRAARGVSVDGLKAS